MVVVQETRGEPDGLIVCHLPLGPTAFFTLSNCVLRHDIADRGPVSEVYPHLILDNFSTPLGQRISDVLKYLFPVPKVWCTCAIHWCMLPRCKRGADDRFISGFPYMQESLCWSWKVKGNTSLLTESVSKHAGRWPSQPCRLAVASDGRRSSKYWPDSVSGHGCPFVHMLLVLWVDPSCELQPNRFARARLCYPFSQNNPGLARSRL